MNGKELLINNQIYVANKPIDLRLGIDGLCKVLKDKYNMDPKNGIYIFYNLKGDKLKLLVWHNNGFILIYKKLEGGIKFKKNTLYDISNANLDVNQIKSLVYSIEQLDA